MIVENALAKYYGLVQDALTALVGQAPSTDDFSPGAELPELTTVMCDYLSASHMAYARMPDYGNKRLSLFDLTGNPATGTTKTFPSLVMVARAVRFIQDTGQPVTIITPSSANKAVALRDAVLRAIKSGLVAADELNVVVLVPAGSIHKLRCSMLFIDDELRARNPIAVFPGNPPERVKAIARRVIDEHRDCVERESKKKLWYTLKLENYLVGDVVRAAVEAEFFPPPAGAPRLHTHAVSSAYGLLGHAYGRELLGDRAAGLPSHYLLVQHLGAPDMVTSLYGDASGVPDYEYDSATGRFRQDANPRFPESTFDPVETLDATFYSRKPVTSPRMNALIRGQGGGGIVVSLAECLDRYGEVRHLLAEAGLEIPSNPTAVLEWSLNMAVTGMLNAIDRGLVSEADIVVHGSGVYTRGGFDALAPKDLHLVEDEDSFRQVILSATAS